MTTFQRLKADAERHGDRIAIEYRGEKGLQQVSYREFFRDCCRAANFFRSFLPERVPVAIAGRNDYTYWIALFAAMFDGNIACPVNPELPSKTIREVFGRRKPALFLYDPGYDHLEEMGRGCSGGCFSLEEFREKIRYFPAEFSEREDLAETDPCVDILTSGTSGTPKIVELNHWFMNPHDYPWKGERYLSVLPMHHVGGIFFANSILERGALVRLSSIAEAVKDMKAFRPDISFMVPSLLRSLVFLDRKGLLDLSCFCTIGTTGAPPEAEVYEYLTRKGITVGNIYGSTELGGGFSNFGDPESPLISFGKGFENPYYQLKFGPGGEILARGRAMMNGYFGDEEATRAAVTDGWYHTGDTGLADDRGYCFVNGRINNLICLSNGENVSPEAIETELCRCNRIRMCMVKALDDEIITEVFYGPEQEAAAEQEISEFIRKYNQEAASVHRIRRIIFRYQPLKTNSMGKLLRN